MGRSNTPYSLENWQTNERSLPFRASIRSNCFWDVGRPPPYLIEASKVCRGGRMILAFPLAETRDYFVEGHADQGAQAEEDFSQLPSPRRLNARTAEIPSDYETAKLEMIAALRDYVAARDSITTSFLRNIMRMVTENKVFDAVALTNSMPSDCVEKTVAWSRILESGKWDTSKNNAHDIGPAPLDACRAAALCKWQRAHNTLKRLEGPFQSLALKKAREVLDEEGHDALLEMIESVPPFIGKVHLVMFARKNAPIPAADRQSTGPRM